MERSAVTCCLLDLFSTQRSSQLPQSPAQGQAVKIPASVGVVALKALPPHEDVLAPNSCFGKFSK